MNQVKSVLMLCLLSVSLLMTGCNEYKSFSSASKVSQLSGNPFMYRLSKGVLASIKDVAARSGNKSAAKGLNLTTTLADVMSTPEQVSALKNQLQTDYKVPMKKMDALWGNVGTVKDLVAMVAKYGRNFNSLQR